MIIRQNGGCALSWRRPLIFCFCQLIILSPLFWFPFSRAVVSLPYPSRITVMCVSGEFWSRPSHVRENAENSYPADSRIEKECQGYFKRDRNFMCETFVVWRIFWQYYVDNNVTREAEFLTIPFTDSNATPFQILPYKTHVPFVSYVAYFVTKLIN